MNLIFLEHLHLGKKMIKKIELPYRGNSLIFVYSTLMHPRSRELAFHKVIDNMKRVSIKDYARIPKTLENGEHVDTIVPKPGHELPGDLLELSPEDLAKLIKWEDRYKLIPVKLKDGRQVQAFQLKE